MAITEIDLMQFYTLLLLRFSMKQVFFDYSWWAIGMCLI